LPYVTNFFLTLLDGCLFRLILSRDPKSGQQLIFYIIHHLISDAVSNILVKNALSNALEEQLGLKPTLSNVFPSQQQPNPATFPNAKNNFSSTSLSPTANSSLTAPNSKAQQQTNTIAEITSYDTYANLYHKWLNMDRLKERTCMFIIVHFCFVLFP
jgi:hypothetical protein